MAVNLPKSPNPPGSGDPQWLVELKAWGEDVVRFCRSLRPHGDQATIRVIRGPGGTSFSYTGTQPVLAQVKSQHGTTANVYLCDLYEADYTTATRTNEPVYVLNYDTSETIPTDEWLMCWEFSEFDAGGGDTAYHVAVYPDWAVIREILRFAPGYDATRNQVLVNDHGTIEWDEQVNVCENCETCPDCDDISGSFQIVLDQAVTVSLGSECDSKSHTFAAGTYTLTSIGENAGYVGCSYKSSNTDLGDGYYAYVWVERTDSGWELWLTVDNQGDPLYVGDDVNSGTAQFSQDGALDECTPVDTYTYTGHVSYGDCVNSTDDCSGGETAEVQEQ